MSDEKKEEMSKEKIIEMSNEEKEIIEDLRQSQKEIEQIMPLIQTEKEEE